MNNDGPDSLTAIDNVIARIASIQDDPAALLSGMVWPEVQASDSNGLVSIQCMPDGTISATVNPIVVGVNGDRHAIQVAVAEAVTALLRSGTNSDADLRTPPGSQGSNDPTGVLGDVRASIEASTEQLNDYMNSLRARVEAIRPRQ